MLVTGEALVQPLETIRYGFIPVRQALANWNTAKMVLDSAGNVGIGTTAPEYGLHLGSNSVPKNLAFTIDNPTQAGIIWKYIGQAKSMQK